MITEESIQKVRDVSIIDVVQLFVKLDRANKACCPLHGEKTPSFSVHPAKQIFKCFGCGEGGDGISFVSKLQSLDFTGAVEFIADKLNIPLDYEKNVDKEKFQKHREERKSLREVLHKAQAWYIKKLAANPKAMEYLERKRRYDIDIITKWGIGFGGSEWRELTELLTQQGLLPQAIQLGLCTEAQKTNSWDFYRNRITFPIKDEHGELISWGGRIYTDEDEADPKIAKYKNGPGISPLYKKDSALFGLYEAKPSIKKAGYAILTEGYTDVISLHEFGATNAVATCGTALTDEHCKLLKRVTAPHLRILIWRDGDSAGINATEKDIQKLMKHGFKVEVMHMEGESNDPDSIVWGLQDEEELIEEPVNEEDAE